MGANTFEVVTKGASARAAFDAAVKQAQYEDGHGGYTGTIAEKREFVVVGSAATVKEALAMARKMVDAGDRRIDDKWGPAGCITVATGEFVFFGWASS